MRHYSCLCLAFLQPILLEAWVSVPVIILRGTEARTAAEMKESGSLRPCTSLNFSTLDSSSVLVAENWRQYIPLVVSCLVIADILLGSPAANSVLRFANPQAESNEDGEGFSLPWMNQKSEEDSKERVDTSAVAQQAVDKAQATLELRNYLEAQKTDWDRIDDMRKQMDKDVSKLDRKLEDM